MLGLILSTQAGVKLMKNGGSVINIGSMAGSMPGPYSSIYSASKGAVNKLDHLLIERTWAEEDPGQCRKSRTG
jgi:3-oxoacyl-[acyl-carrier protein] reductase